MQCDVANCGIEEDLPELAAYYADRRLMWRNVFWILIGNLGSVTCFSVLGTLMILRLNTAGVGERGIGLINSANAWVVSFLVMYFSWKSDHRVSRWGRRRPYLFLSLPFLIGTIILFPLVTNKWLLIGLMLVHLYFLDMKNSTYPLLSIDCVDRRMLARVNGLTSTVLVIAGFLAIRYGMRLADYNEYLPYLLAGGVLIVTALLAGFMIQEPPIHNSTNERFNPLSALRVGWRDRRIIVLMTAVSLVPGFALMYGNWIWLYLKNDLGLTRTQGGAAISWGFLVTAALAVPVGWLIDRWGSYKVLVGYWLVSLAGLWAVLHMTDGVGLVWASILTSALAPLYAAADMLVYKLAPPKDVGSVTSSLSLIRNFTSGCLVFASGYIIEAAHGGYHLVFKLGFIVTTVGLALFFLYQWLMRRPARLMVSPLPVGLQPE